MRTANKKKSVKTNSFYNSFFESHCTIVNNKQQQQQYYQKNNKQQYEGTIVIYNKFKEKLYFYFKL